VLLLLLLLLLQFEENDEYLNGKQLLKKRLDLYTLAEYSVSVGQRPVWMCRVSCVVCAGQ
jgi:predicted metal-binding protein